MKIKTNFAQMIVDIIDEQPYYNIFYLDPRDGEYHVGYGSYVLGNTHKWLMENFELSEGDAYNPVTKLQEELKVRCCEIADLKHLCDRLRDENSKLGIKYEKLLKEKSDLDREMGRLEGQVEAFQFVWHCRK